MRRAPQWLLPVSSVLLLSLLACGASTLRRSQIDLSDLASVRSEYLARNPDTPYYDHISHGEIVRGMDTHSVIASWGLPAQRVSDGPDFERWLYVDKEGNLDQSVGYALNFDKHVLKSWNVQRVPLGLKTDQSAAGLAPPQDPTTGKPSLTN